MSEDTLIVGALLDHEGVAGGSVCAACHGDQDVRLQDTLLDLGFCGDCLDRARMSRDDTDTDDDTGSDLGGEA